MHAKRKTRWIVGSIILIAAVSILAVVLGGDATTQTVYAAAVDFDNGIYAQAGGTGFAQDDDPPPPVDHSNFANLQQDFQSGSEVTEQCLSCHQDAAQEIMQTTHWTWSYTHPETGQELGKYNVINNFGIAVPSNEPVCTRCHIGYGWEDASFDFNNEQNVDCLVCHDTTGSYTKSPVDAGEPVLDSLTFEGQTFKAVDLSYVAQNVGPTSRESCGNCHFNGAGGSALEHGNIAATLANPDSSLDVHMGVDGNDFSCTTCHQTDGHKVEGSRFAMNSTDEGTCETCHTATPHDYPLLNNHLDRVACQTCHITEDAREAATKVSWDWSAAGELDSSGNPIIRKDADGNVIYDSRLGAFEHDQNIIPEYVWFNGSYEYTLLDDPFTAGSQQVVMNPPQGSIADPDARIWPMKSRIGILPYDKSSLTFVIPQLSGSDAAYWNSYDWNQAITAGMNYIGAEYSGNFDFVETKMYWPITHMIAPAADSLKCQDCHTQESGRIDFVALGYSVEEAERLTNFPPALEIELNQAETNTPEYCSTCHGEQYNLWLDSSHSDNSVGCVSCHTKAGEGEHPAVAYTSEKSADVCGACHLAEHSDWDLSRHAEVSIACGDCHEPHRQGQRIVGDNRTACESCHRNQADEVIHSTHWQKGLSCVDCHMRTDADTGHNFHIYIGTCLSCHSEDIHTSSTIVDMESALLQGEPLDETMDEGEAMSEAAETEVAAEDNGAIIEFPWWIMLILGGGLGAVAYWVIAGKTPGDEHEENRKAE
ncbi:MAG: tetrathionate reductase family octaheme c-type cytochrome [Anaerolineales bacterium]|nr:tetrathionate reductase family octaheme c-type cytochrome [Anaerolineales bacterium]